MIENIFDTVLLWRAMYWLDRQLSDLDAAVAALQRGDGMLDDFAYVYAEYTLRPAGPMEQYISHWRSLGGVRS